MHGFTQKELIAHRMYRTYGVRVTLQLSAHAAKRAKVRGAALRAGLQELAAAQLPHVVRGTFQSETEFQNELLAMRASVHAAQVGVELHP
jgi:hypothetical protein